MECQTLTGNSQIKAKSSSSEIVVKDFMICTAFVSLPRYSTPPHHFLFFLSFACFRPLFFYLFPTNNNKFKCTSPNRIEQNKRHLNV